MYNDLIRSLADCNRAAERLQSVTKFVLSLAWTKDKYDAAELHMLRSELVAVAADCTDLAAELQKQLNEQGA